MARLRQTLAAALFVMGAGCSLAAVPTRQDALQAISVLEKNLLGTAATDAAKTVVIYAQLSEDVMVDIGPAQLPWLSENWGLERDREAALHSMLLAAFVAGDVKPQIKNEKAEDDTYSGWLFAIDSYHRLRAKERFRSPALEALAKMQSEGTLRKHAQDVHLDGQADPAAAQKKPFA